MRDWPSRVRRSSRPCGRIANSRTARIGSTLRLAVTGLALRDEKHHLNPIVDCDDNAGTAPLNSKSSPTRIASSRADNKGTMESMAEGVEIYAGPFSAGEPGDWLLPLRPRHEHLYVTMLERLALIAAQCDDYEVATGYAKGQ